MTDSTPIRSTRVDLVHHSLEVLERGQAASGAFIAAPAFPTYRYCWFRDGAFIAQALDLWDRPHAAHRFYEWGSEVILRYTPAVERALAAPVGTPPLEYLHTRYRTDGTPGRDDWPNFQLDGFGTFLWGMAEYLDRHPGDCSPQWERAILLLARYLAHLWPCANFDCWEEAPDRIHVSTLAALYGGLRAASRVLSDARIRDAAAEIRRYVLNNLAPQGHLPKSVGIDAVDGSLLWAGVPYGLLDVEHPVMHATRERIEAEIVDTEGAVHRYACDSYYGGGAWLLLTAALGENCLASGRADRAAAALEWIEAQVTPAGDMPEQVSRHLNVPSMLLVWRERWGEVATPLLWSHAAYLRLTRALG